VILLKYTFEPDFIFFGYKFEPDFKCCSCFSIGSKFEGAMQLQVSLIRRWT